MKTTEVHFVLSLPSCRFVSENTLRIHTRSERGPCHSSGRVDFKCHLLPYLSTTGPFRPPLVETFRVLRYDYSDLKCDTRYTSMFTKFVRLLFEFRRIYWDPTFRFSLMSFSSSLRESSQVRSPLPPCVLLHPFLSPLVSFVSPCSFISPKPLGTYMRPTSPLLLRLQRFGPLVPYVLPRFSSNKSKHCTTKFSYTPRQFHQLPSVSSCCFTRIVPSIS